MEREGFDRRACVASRRLALSAFFGESFVLKGARFALPLSIAQVMLIIFRLTTAAAVFNVVVAAAAFVRFIAEFHRRLLFLGRASRRQGRSAVAATTTVWRWLQVFLRLQLMQRVPAPAAGVVAPFGVCRGVGITFSRP